ncbi:MAG: GNAT family N-acetyltransferase [Thermoleophilia bacterium]
MSIDLRPADADADLALLHGWMQQPHVIPWWDLEGDPERTRRYLEGQIALPHSRSWIAVDDCGIPFAYLETYAAADDPLAAHYEARPGDRGWHVLVGPASYLGSGIPRRLGREVVLRLMSEPGAERVVCEPDARNRRMIAFCERLGGVVDRHLDLPDKRAALMVWTRAAVDALWPGEVERRTRAAR